MFKSIVAPVGALAASIAVPVLQRLWLLEHVTVFVPTTGSLSSASPFSVQTAPVLSVSSTTVTTGTAVTVTLTGGFGGSTDWLSFANTGAGNSSYVQYTYVGAGVTTRTWTVVVTGPGTYEFRLFSDGYNRLATSAPITVAESAWNLI